MAEIPASLVVKLRKMSGQGMMDCKKALEEAGGDLDEAMTLLRKKGLATLAKRADRETSEGRLVRKIADDKKTAAMATLCCETDFVANSDDFAKLAESLGNYLLACNADEGTDNLLNTEISGKKFADVLTESVSRTGEKTEIGDYARFRVTGAGIIGTYIHFNSKIGAMVEIETSDDGVADNPAMKQLADDIAMHIAAVNPIALDATGIDAETIQKEKAIAAEQVKNKPADIVDKIVEGKMKKFFAENCLLEQGFVKDDKTPVAKVLADAAKNAGGQAKIKRFVRFRIG